MTESVDGTTAIENARVVTPSGVIPDGHLLLDGDRIAAVGSSSAPASADRRIDAGGATAIPGLVDLHGDEIERHLFPRTDARVRTATALTTSDRANAAAGITTKFHALAFEDAPDKNRSPDTSEAVIRELRNATDLLIDHRVHARCEVNDPQCVDRTIDLVDSGRADLVSIMRHVPGDGQFDDREQFDRRYAADGSAGPSDLDALIERRRRADGLGCRADRLANRARASGLPMASHDDGNAAVVEQMNDRGVSICEYPVTLEAARRAHELGMTTAMGAPNLVRGGSLWNNLGVDEALDAGVVDVLCSDYHPYSLIESIFVDTGEDLASRIQRVTRAPAAAVGLADRGRLASGARADVVLVDPESPPTVRRTFVAGTEVFRSQSPP